MSSSKMLLSTHSTCQNPKDYHLSKTTVKAYNSREQHINMFLTDSLMLSLPKSFKLFMNVYYRCVRTQPMYMRREEKPTRCHWMVCCNYNMHQNVSGTSMPIIRSSIPYVCYYRLWRAVLGCWLLGVRCRAAGYVSRQRDVARRATSPFLDT